ncbi:MAG: hypothetical protein H7Z37_13775 [Pyrinomonadaceae bacterium]|nr:hypothetical protein [Pyrinomonadaceae bacterium]
MNSLTENKKTDEFGSSKMILVVMVFGALIAGGVIFWIYSQPEQKQVNPLIANALREGVEFEALKKKTYIEINRDFTSEANNMMGNVQMNIVGVVRNFTGKTITALEVVGTVIDKEGNTVKEKSQIVVPTALPKIENNKSTPVTIVLDGFKPGDKRDDVKLRISAIRVE